MYNWLEQIKNGVKPSVLLTSEVEKLDEEYSANELAHVFVEQIQKVIDEDAMEIDLGEICYPIWYWEKPDKRRVNGITSERMDEWIIAILTDWELLPKTNNLD